MKEFAKIFNSEEYGQILVKHDQSDDGAMGAEIRFYSNPPNLGVCSSALIFNDSEEAWDKSEEEFEKIDLEKCEMIIKPVWDMGC